MRPRGRARADMKRRAPQWEANNKILAHAWAELRLQFRCNHELETALADAEARVRELESSSGG